MTETNTTETKIPDYNTITEASVLAEHLNDKMSEALEAEDYEAAFGHAMDLLRIDSAVIVHLLEYVPDPELEGLVLPEDVDVESLDVDTLREKLFPAPQFQLVDVEQLIEMLGLLEDDGAEPAGEDGGQPFAEAE